MISYRNLAQTIPAGLFKPRETETYLTDELGNRLTDESGNYLVED